jgi:hypothetical protein
MHCKRSVTLFFKIFQIFIYMKSDMFQFIIFSLFWYQLFFLITSSPSYFIFQRCYCANFISPLLSLVSGKIYGKSSKDFQIKRIKGIVMKLSGLFNNVSGSIKQSSYMQYKLNYRCKSYLLMLFITKNQQMVWS